MSWEFCQKQQGVSWGYTLQRRYAASTDTLQPPYAGNDEGLHCEYLQLDLKARALHLDQQSVRGAAEKAGDWEQLPWCCAVGVRHPLWQRIPLVKGEAKWHKSGQWSL